jgi:CHAT domain-containing protein
MNQRDTALASLWGRTYRAAVTPVTPTLFDEAALDDARQLRAATDLLTDIPAAHALGWFHWLRYLTMPGQDATEEELSAALNLLKPVFEQNPYAVPEPVQRWYLQTEAGLYAGREQLPVLHSVARSIVDAAPPGQPDRTRSLLDAALMLRSIAGRGGDDALLRDAAQLTLAALGTSQATLPPPTGIHPAAALQAFLEPVSGPTAAKSPDTTARHPEAPPPQRPAEVRMADQVKRATSGYASGPGPEHPSAGYRYPAARAEQPPALSQDAHPYAAFSGTGYGDDSYSDPGYQGQSAQDAGIAGTRTIRGFVESGRGQSGYPETAHGADLYEQPWDYDQPLRYDREEGSGSDSSMPSADGPGYDLSGVIGTSDFEATGYDEPTHERLSYDDPRHVDAPPYQEPQPRFDETRRDMSARAQLGGPAFDETRLDNLRLSRENVRREARAVGPGRSLGPATAASFTPPATQSRSWAEDTSLDHFADLDLTDEPPARFLTGMLPESAPAGRRISLMVQVTLTGQPGVSAPLKPMAVPPGGCYITITVTAPGLVPVGDLEQDLYVPAASDSEPIRFGFRTGRAGLHPVLVRAFAAGTFVGELALQVSVEAGGRLEEGPVRAAVLAGLVAEPGEVTLQVSRTDEDRYSFQLIGEAFYPVELTRRLAGDPAEVVRALTEELHAMAAQESRYASPALVRNRIRSLGAQLWAEVVPDTIRRQFWEQAGRIKLFTVASDMDTVPWELLYPIDGGNDNGFLVEQFPVVRRVYGQSRARHLSLSSAAYVVPPGSPANAMDEVEIVKARLGATVRHREVCSRLDTLLGILEDSPSVLHFACHNEFTSRAGSVISLDGGPLRPSDLAPARQAGSMASSSPLVFLNACRTAGEIPGLMEMMGWARQFMGAGAGAFIGSLWAVRSSSAKAFADTFYQALVSEAAPLGEASLRARRAIAADAGDPTWLAYTIYGNPSATLQ